MASLIFSKFGQNLSVTSFVAISHAAVGFGIGLLVADKLDQNLRQKIAIGLIGAGAAVVVPIFAGIYTRVNDRPDSPQSMRRRLNSIREGNGFPEPEEIL